MNTITYNNKTYPKFQSEGFAAQFAIPYAKHICIGRGYDIGCNKLEWRFPNSIPIEPRINEFDAMNLPDGEVDYIFARLGKCIRLLVI